MPATADHASRDPLLQMLRKALVEAARSGLGAAPGGTGSVPLRACAALYELLQQHPVDQWDRCRSCRAPGSMFGLRWQQCRVYAKANLCLRRLDEVLLLSPLIEELGLAAVSPPAAPGPARTGDA